MEKIRRIFYSLLVFVFSGCFSAGIPANSFSLVSWNVQTFFDGNKDGTEYSNFQKSQDWGEAAYKKRLEKLCAAINSINADIFVFEEIENSGILYDISNFLASKSWNSRKNWNYGAFSKNPGDSIGCAVLSKFPISKVTVHNLDVRTENSAQPSMRPLMKVEILFEGKIFCIFANHWKSKSGGAEESEIWRNWQETLLVKKFIEQQEIPSVACGDFNRDISEFKRNYCASGNGNGKSAPEHENLQNIELRSTAGNSSAENMNVAVHSPWLDESGFLEEPGSYYYNENWERIDHFFSNSKAALKDFEVLTEGEWCGENFIPKPYRIYTGEGFSDHLPIKCTVGARF